MIKKIRNLCSSLDARNIFLLDGIGAFVSTAVTGLLLPLISDWVGLPVSILQFLAAFPFCYGIYSLSCYWFAKTIKPGMLIAIVLANLAYCIISALFIFTYPSLTIWGQLFLTSEILIVLLVVAIELKVYQKTFIAKQRLT